MIPLDNILPNWCILLAECTFNITHFRAVAIYIQEEFIATIHSIVIRDYQLVTDAILAHWIVVCVDTEIWTSIWKVCLVTWSAESSIIDSIEVLPGMAFYWHTPNIASQLLISSWRHWNPMTMASGNIQWNTGMVLQNIQRWKCRPIAWYHQLLL